MNKAFKEVCYIVEYTLVKIFIFIFKILKFKKSTKLSIFLTKFVGKRLSVHKLAKDNIRKSIKKLTEKEIENIVDNMWENLGRNIAEYYFINKKSKKEINKIVSLDENSKKNFQKLKRSKKGGILFSAHFGNWEVGGRYLGLNDFKCKTLYRPFNNKYVNQLISVDKRKNIKLIRKGSAGNKEMIKSLKNGEFIIVLADQRVGDGIEVPFFGRKALTSTSLAKLVLKYNVPLIPIRIIRKNNETNFNMEILDPLDVVQDKELTMDKKIYKITKEVNKTLEGWIRKSPEQWFWVHNRWKK
jgi:KDO2-lipid IV(A) lauroyltransferase